MADNMIGTGGGIQPDSLEPGKGLAPEQTPDADSADQFDKLMNAGQQPQEQTPAELPDAVNKLDGTEQASKPTLGDKILQGFQGVRDNIEGQAANIHQKMNSSEIMSTKDIIETQQALAKLQVTEDLVGKIVSKSTQNLESLLKNQ
ncbi:type III secretion system inner rod subunit SctI [Spongorhabdus nitratireducens]